MSKKDNKKEITHKQLLFCYEYIANKFNGEAAYKKIYNVKSDNAARVNASKLLTNTNIKNKLDNLLKEYFKSIGCKVQDILNELVVLGFSNIGDFVTWEEGGKNFKLKKTDEIGNRINCINELNIVENEFKGVKTTKIKLKLHDKTKALELLGKHADLFKIEEEEEEKGDVILHIEPEDIQGKDAAQLARDYSALLRNISKSK